MNYLYLGERSTLGALVIFLYSLMCLDQKTSAVINNIMGLRHQVHQFLSINHHQTKTELV